MNRRYSMSASIRLLLIAALAAIANGQETRDPSGENAELSTVTESIHPNAPPGEVAIAAVDLDAVLTSAQMVPLLAPLASVTPPRPSSSPVA